MAQVAVITGASSGIGRATALRLARKGINLVLASRRGHVLEDVASECRRRGVEAIAVEVDVSDEEQVQSLSQAATDHFGHFDIWINNAGVSIVGAFNDVPSEAFNKVLETNFFGVVYGSRVALEHFNTRDKGILINVSSMFGAVPSPYESAYVASKFAVRGFSGSIRQELYLAGKEDIHVSTVMPAAIDTPIYRNASNLMHHPVKPPAPIYPVRIVADAIEDIIDDPKDEVIVGGSGKMMAAVRSVLPGSFVDKAFARYIQATHFTRKDASDTSGNLFVPSEYSTMSGHWPRTSPKKKAVYAAAGLAVGVGLLLWLKNRNRGEEA